MGRPVPGPGRLGSALRFFGSGLVVPSRRLLLGQNEEKNGMGLRKARELPLYIRLDRTRAKCARHTTNKLIFRVSDRRCKLMTRGYCTYGTHTSMSYFLMAVAARMTAAAREALAAARTFLPATCGAAATATSAAAARLARFPAFRRNVRTHIEIGRAQK